MINRVTLIGNLGQDPELRTTGGGTAVSNLRVATTRRAKSTSGEWEEQTEWVSCVVFSKTAENCCNYLSKGRQVYVEGRLQTRKWQDREGNDRYTTEVVADVVKFLGSKGERPQQRGGYQGGGYGSDTDSVPF